MPGVIYHEFTSPIADATGVLTVGAFPHTSTVAASDVVNPTDWNSAHVMAQGLLGNTAGISSISGSNIWLAGGANVTLSASQGTDGAATLSIRAAGGGAGGSISFSAGTQSDALDLVEFSNANGVSFGLDGSTITASVETNYLTTQTAFVFSNSNNISFGTNGSTVTATVNARASNDAIGLNTAQTNVTWTVNSSGLSLNAAGYAGTGFTTATTAGTAIIGTLDTNGLSMGVPNYLTTARGSTDGIGLNTAQTNVTWTVNSSGLSLNAAGYAGTGTTFAGANISGSITQNSAGLNLSLSANAPGAASLNVSAGTTSNDLTQLVFSNANGVSFGLDGSTVTASASGDAGGVNTISFWDNVGLAQTFNGNAWWANSSSGIQPIVLPLPISVSFARFLGSVAINSTTLNSTADTSFSGALFNTFVFGLYTQLSGVSSQSLGRFFTASAGYTLSHALTADTAGSQYTVQVGVTYPSSGVTSTSSASYASTQTNFALNTSQFSQFSARRYIDIPLLTSIPASNYWLVGGASFDSVTVVTNAQSRFQIEARSVVAVTDANIFFGDFGIATTTSNWVRPGGGLVTATISLPDATVALSDIRTAFNNARQYVQLQRTA